MQQTVVNPPATAAADPAGHRLLFLIARLAKMDVNVDQARRDIHPRRVDHPIGAGPGSMPIAAILPSRIRTSARRSKTREGSRTVPCWMRRDGMISRYREAGDFNCAKTPRCQEAKENARGQRV